MKSFSEKYAPMFNRVKMFDEMNGWLYGRNMLLNTRDGGKTWLWVASDYFSSTSWGICADVEKLSKINEGGKYILILATKNPEYEERGDWLKGIDKFNAKFSHLHIKSYTNPSDFPPSYFLGLLEVTR